MHHLLQYDFENRKKKNPALSFRSYARILNIDPSYLRKMFNGQRPINSAIRELLLKGIPVPPKKLARFKQLPFDDFQNLNHWYTSALYELLKLKNGKWTSRELAKCLQVNELQVIQTLESLKRSLLVVEKSKNHYQTKNITPTNTKIQKTDHSAFRNLQTEYLRLAMESVRNREPQERHQSGMTLAIHKKDLHRAEKMLDAFRRRFLKKMENNENPNDIYHLCLSFFPVTSKTELEKIL